MTCTLSLRSVAAVTGLALLVGCKSSPFACDSCATGHASAAAAPVTESTSAARPPSPPAPPTSPTASAPASATASAATPSSAPTPPAPAAPATAPAAAAPWPTTFSAFVLRLIADTATGRDPALVDHADLLAVAARLGGDATAETTIVRVPELEDAERGRVGRGLGWATATSYVEAGGDATAIREAFLDLDRVPEWTGKPGTRRVERRGDVVVGFVDGVRRTLGFEYGARWRFEAHSIDRGAARISASHQVEDPLTWRMLSTRLVVIMFPEPGGVRVVEVAVSVLDFDVPPLLKNIAIQSAIAEMKTRQNAIRAHWREYVGRAR